MVGKLMIIFFMDYVKKAHVTSPLLKSKRTYVIIKTIEFVMSQQKTGVELL